MPNFFFGENERWLEEEVTKIYATNCILGNASLPADTKCHKDQVSSQATKEGAGEEAKRETE